MRVCFLTPASLARALGVSPSTVLDRIHRGEIRAQRLPGDRTHWRIPLTDAQAFARAAGAELPPLPTIAGGEARGA